MNGSYVLLVELPDDRYIPIGKLGRVFFPKACYAYVGSAMNGFAARLGRHLRREKKLHWHIDYFLKEAEIREIVLCRTDERVECALSLALAKHFPFIPGFGSSDCKCDSHLYFGNEKEGMKFRVAQAASEAGLAVQVLSVSSGDRGAVCTGMKAPEWVLPMAVNAGFQA